LGRKQTLAIQTKAILQAPSCASTEISIATAPPASRGGMSRKAAYALKARDPAFAAAWIAAEKGAAGSSVQGAKVEEVEAARFPSGRVRMSPSRLERRRTFAGLVAQLRESPPLAPRASGQ